MARHLHCTLHHWIPPLKYNNRRKISAAQTLRPQISPSSFARSYVQTSHTILIISLVKQKIYVNHITKMSLQRSYLCCCSKPNRLDTFCDLRCLVFLDYELVSPKLNKEVVGDKQFETGHCPECSSHQISKRIDEPIIRQKSATHDWPLPRLSLGIIFYTLIFERK